MAEYKDMVITNKGKDLINRQLIGAKNFEITKIVVGTGIHEDTENLEECEDLKNPLKDYEIYSMERKDRSVEIKSVVTNISFVQEALLHEVGVYASDGTDEILYAIATAVYPLQIPAYNGEFEYKIDFVMHFTIDSGVGIILRDRTDIATEKAAGAVKASEDIKVEKDGTMRIADYESNDSDNIADVPEYQVNLTEPPTVGKGRIPLGWKETKTIKKSERLPAIIGKLTNIAYNVKWLFKWLNSINTIGEYTSVDSQGNIVRVKNSASDVETGVPFPFPIQTVVEGHELALRQLNTESQSVIIGNCEATTFMWVSAEHVISHFISHPGANKLKINLTQITLGRYDYEHPTFEWAVTTTSTGFWITTVGADQKHYFENIYPGELWNVKYTATNI